MAEYVDVVGGSNRKFVIAADNVAARKDDGTLVDLVVDGVAVGGGGGDNTALTARVDAIDTLLDEFVPNMDQATTQLASQQATTNTNVTNVTTRVTNAETAATALTTRTAAVETNANAGLPAVALSRYASVWGDSRTNQNWTQAANPTTQAPLARSWLWWAEALSYGRVRMTNRYNFGVSGDTITQVVARMNANTANVAGVLPNAVPAGPAILFVGTNSINAGLSLASAMTQLNLAIDWLQARNHKVFVIAEWPRGIGSVEGTTAVLTAANQKLMLAYHKELLKLSQMRRGITVVNPWGRMIDPASATLNPLPGLIATDGLHNSPGNALITGSLLAAAFKDAGLPRAAYGISSNFDLWATNNLFGILSKNPLLQLGTGGTLASGTNTGTIPQDWALTIPAGITSTSSFVNTVDNNGVLRPAYRLVLSGTATGAASSVMLRQSGLYDATKMTGQDAFEGVTEYRVAAGYTNLGAAGPSITDGTAQTAAYGGLVLTGDPAIPTIITDPIQLLAQSNEFVLGGSVTAVNFEWRLYLPEAIATSITIDIFSAGMRKRQLPGA